MHQTRYDLEFMADCLGIIDSACACPHRHHVFASTTLLAERVTDYMRDPVANILAQRRLSALRRALPDRSVAFPRMGRTIRDEYHRRSGHVDLVPQDLLDALSPDWERPGPMPAFRGFVTITV